MMSKKLGKLKMPELAGESAESKEEPSMEMEMEMPAEGVSSADPEAMAKISDEELLAELERRGLSSEGKPAGEDSDSAKYV